MLFEKIRKPSNSSPDRETILDSCSIKLSDKTSLDSRVELYRNGNLWRFPDRLKLIKPPLTQRRQKGQICVSWPWPFDGKIGTQGFSKVRFQMWWHLIWLAVRIFQSFCGWANGNLNDKRAEDVWSSCHLGGRPITKPATSASGPSQSQFKSAKAKSAMRCQKVSAKVCRQPSLRLQRSTPWRRRVASFPQSALPP